MTISPFNGPYYPMVTWNGLVRIAWSGVTWNSLDMMVNSISTFRTNICLQFIVGYFIYGDNCYTDMNLYQYLGVKSVQAYQLHASNFILSC